MRGGKSLPMGGLLPLLGVCLEHHRKGLAMKKWMVLGGALIVWGISHAQTFKMPCDVSGTIPDLDNTKLAPERIVVEIQSMGKNLFLKIPNSKSYSAQASSLETDDFLGKNLTTAQQMGANRKNKATGAETEIRIVRQTRVLYGYTDTNYQGKNVRVFFEGPCTPPAQ